MLGVFHIYIYSNARNAGITRISYFCKKYFCLFFTRQEVQNNIYLRINIFQNIYFSCSLWGELEGC
ncbi:MAG: hypothetical protein MRERV_32c034 [Mycoplasmataceae bacterium RV_VA103A]|nr:MAG: hypothetical protein MRERV_32c034 [Mycoplasmataceae bacterium RV_VA103A]